MKSIRAKQYALACLSLRFMHNVNDADEWLVASMYVVLPMLHEMYTEILTTADGSRVTAAGEVKVSITSHLKDTPDALRALNGAMELMIDFCDVQCDDVIKHLTIFIRAASAVLFGSDVLREPQVNTTTSKMYAMDELVRCASFALCDILMSFDHLLPDAEQFLGKRVSILFKFLGCARELSIQRSLIVVLKILHCANNARDGTGSLLRDVIEHQMKQSPIWTTDAVTKFKALAIGDSMFQNCYDIIKRLNINSWALCFNTPECTVQVKRTEDKLSNRRVQFQRAAVDWNVNSFVIRVGKNLATYWPLFAISRMEWRRSGRDFWTLHREWEDQKETEIVIRLGNSMTAEMKDMMQERIEQIMKESLYVDDSDGSSVEMEEYTGSQRKISCTSMQARGNLRETDMPNENKDAHVRNNGEAGMDEMITNELNYQDESDAEEDGVEVMADEVEDVAVEETMVHTVAMDVATNKESCNIGTKGKRMETRLQRSIVDTGDDDDGEDGASGNDFDSKKGKHQTSKTKSVQNGRNNQGSEDEDANEGESDVNDMANENGEISEEAEELTSNGVENDNAENYRSADNNMDESDDSILVPSDDDVDDDHVPNEKVTANVDKKTHTGKRYSQKRYADRMEFIDGESSQSTSEGMNEGDGLLAEENEREIDKLDGHVGQKRVEHSETGSEFNESTHDSEAANTADANEADFDFDADLGADSSVDLNEDANVADVDGSETGTSEGDGEGDSELNDVEENLVDYSVLRTQLVDCMAGLDGWLKTDWENRKKLRGQQLKKAKLLHEQEKVKAKKAMAERLEAMKKARLKQIRDDYNNRQKTLNNLKAELDALNVKVVQEEKNVDALEGRFNQRVGHSQARINGYRERMEGELADLVDSSRKAHAAAQARHQSTMEQMQKKMQI